MRRLAALAAALALASLAAAQEPVAAETTCVVVRLLEADGRPWSGAQVRARESGYPEGEWPRAPYTFANVCAGGGGARAPRRAVGEPVARGEVAYEALAGECLVVGAFGGTFGGETRRVEVGAEPVVVEIRARAGAELGTVSVRVRRRGGAELGLAGDESRFTVELASRDGSVVYVADGPHRAAPPWVLRAPAGEYRVVARGYPVIEPYHAGLVRARDLGQARADVVVTAGASSAVELELDGGGRLELTLAGEVDESEVVLASRDAFGGESVGSVELLLVGAGGGDEALVRRIEGLYQPNLVDLWPLGATYVSEILPTGRATVVARLRGGREVRLEVELREGETTRATLSLGSEPRSERRSERGRARPRTGLRGSPRSVSLAGRGVATTRRFPRVRRELSRALSRRRDGSTRLGNLHRSRA